MVNTQTWVPQNKRSRHFIGDSYIFDRWQLNYFFRYSATLLLNHFEPGENICKKSTVGVILMGSQFCEHVLQVVINSELLALAVSTRLYMMVLDSAPRMESTLIWFLRPTVKGRMARSVWLFLPMRNKRQLSGRVSADDSLSGFYTRIYRITAGLSFLGGWLLYFPLMMDRCVSPVLRNIFETNTYVKQITLEFHMQVWTPAKLFYAVKLLEVKTNE